MGILKIPINHYFLQEASTFPPDAWRNNPDLLIDMLRQYEMDIWFSTEGTAPFFDQHLFLDGDLLSAKQGIIIASNDMLLNPSVPAGIPDRGVDFGVDAVMMEKRIPENDLILFSEDL